MPSLLKKPSESPTALATCCLALLVLYSCGGVNPSPSQPLADAVGEISGLPPAPVVSETGQTGGPAWTAVDTIHINEQVSIAALGVVDERGGTIAKAFYLYHELFHAFFNSLAPPVECGGPGANTLNEITSLPATTSKCCHLAIYSKTLEALCEVIAELAAESPPDPNVGPLCRSYNAFRNKLKNAGAACSTAGFSPPAPLISFEIPVCPACP